MRCEKDNCVIALYDRLIIMGFEKVCGNENWCEAKIESLAENLRKKYLVAAEMRAKVLNLR